MKKQDFRDILLTKKIREKLYKQFGYSAVGYYYEIIDYLINIPTHIIEIKNLNKISRDLKIKRKILEKFIFECTQIINTKGFPLLSTNEKYIWNDYILSIHNKKKQKHRGGRKKTPITESIYIKEGRLVNLTQKQHETLIKKYGYIFIKNAISIFNCWLEQNTNISKRYLNKNNYANFRSDAWVINQTEKLLSADKTVLIYTPDSCINFNKLL